MKKVHRFRSFWGAQVPVVALASACALFEVEQRGREPLTLGLGDPAPPIAAPAAQGAEAAAASSIAAPRREGAPLRSRELHWTFPKAPFGGTDVVLSIPVSNDPAQRFPVLVAFHGRGESVRGSRRGARGWLDDYRLDRALQRVVEPPLREDDFEGFTTVKRLRQLNRGLVEHPYAGLIVVCPFLPDILKGEAAFVEAEPLTRFVVEVLLPRVYAKTPALGTPAATGIDGVSLGGRAALLVGLSRPAAFGSVGGLQAALDEKELGRLSELAARALAQNPSLRLRLLTSDEDYFELVNRRFSKRLEQKGVPHELVEVTGTHSYRFNRGPGALEMLLHQDRVLRGLPSP